MATGAASSKGWMNNIQAKAAGIFFILIVFQIPLFRVPCRAGMCSTPLHFTSSQLITSEIFPVPIVKALLYPGALANGLVKNMTVPSWDNLLEIYNLTNAKEANPITDLQRLEVLTGSYFSGAFVGVLKSGRMSMFGTLLLIWGLIKEGIIGKPVNTDPTKAGLASSKLHLSRFVLKRYCCHFLFKSPVVSPIVQYISYQYSKVGGGLRKCIESNRRFYITVLCHLNISTDQRGLHGFCYSSLHSAES